VAISGKSPPYSAGAKDLNFIGKMREVSIARGQKRNRKWRKWTGKETPFREWIISL